MSEVIPVCIPHETVNDDQVLIQQWKVADGQAVRSGQILVEVETSKSVFEITSPADGFIRLNAASDQEVPIGKVLCYIGETLEAVDASLLAVQQPTAGPAKADALNAGSMDLVVSEPASVVLPGRPATISSTDGGNGIEDIAAIAQSTRFSETALALLQKHGLPATSFERRGLVRSEDVLRAISPPQLAVTKPVPGAHGGLSSSPLAEPSRAIQQFRSAAGVPFRREPLARSKRIETKVLSWSRQQAIRSSVTVIVPTTGRHRLLELDSDAAEKTTAKIIQSTAQLLREVPLLNACCIDDQVMVYEQVNIGYALDAGYGLKVAVLRDAETQSVPAIMEERQRLIAAYLNQSLLPADLSGATFTITDLSGSGVSTFDPIISEGQAGILGIGGEFSIGDGQAAFLLILSFDHRLVEGRTAAMFLNQLKDHVTSFEQSLLAASSQEKNITDACCSRCGISLSAAALRNHFLVSVAALHNSSSLMCTICLQGR